MKKYTKQVFDFGKINKLAKNRIIKLAVGYKSWDYVHLFNIFTMFEFKFNICCRLL